MENGRWNEFSPSCTELSLSSSVVLSLTDLLLIVPFSTRKFLSAMPVPGPLSHIFYSEGFVSRVFSLSCCIITRETSLSLCFLAASSCRSCWSILSCSWNSGVSSPVALPSLHAGQSASLGSGGVLHHWSVLFPICSHIVRNLFYQHFLTIITVCYFFCLPHFSESVC